MEGILANIKAFTGDVIPTKAEKGNKSQVVERGVRFAGIVAICFSKDRPYQLYQLLASIFTHTDLLAQEVVVIYSTSSYQIYYDKIRAIFPTITFKREGKGFDNSLRELLNSSLQASHLLFLVDDLIFIETIRIRDAMQNVFAAENSIFGLLLKLHPGICYGHAASKVCFPPALQSLLSKSKQAPHLLSFSWKNGTVDWKYPIDLCGGLYRYGDILEIVNLIPLNTIANPNVLEVLANEVFDRSQLSHKYNCLSCFDRCVSVIITVNRVQSTYEVPIYKAPEYTLDCLNSYLSLPQQSVPMYDYNSYQQRNYISAHIGDVYFEKKAMAVVNSLAVIKISVLIPVHNGEEFIQSCIESLLDCSEEVKFDIIVVDDGSTDQTPNLLSLLHNVASDKYNMSLTVHRLNEQKGVAHALDAGLAMCRTPYVARLDADDINLPGRLSRQLKYLEANPDIHVVGTQAWLFYEEPGRLSDLALMRTNPMLVHYDMLSRCPLLHPTVMFRREVVLELGGYFSQNAEKVGEGGRLALSKEQKYVEDYILWVKLALKYPHGLTNLPFAGIQLRIHSQSKSSLEKIISRQAALKVRTEFIKGFLSLMDDNSIDRDSIEKYTAIWTHPSQYLQSLEDLLSAMQCLQQVTDLLTKSYVPKLDHNEEVESVKACIKHMYQTKTTKIIASAKKKYSAQDLGRVLNGSEFCDCLHEDIVVLKEMIVEQFTF